MNIEKVNKIILDTAYTRIGGSKEEARTAEYIAERCKELGLEARFEEFDVATDAMDSASLTVDGESIDCAGFLCCGSGEVEAPFYYLVNSDEYSLSLCKGCIVLIDAAQPSYWMYRDLVDNGAVGIITYCGDYTRTDNDIIEHELRSYVSEGTLLPCVTVNAKTAVELVRRGAKSAKISIKQTESTGKSRNVIADLPGETEETIIFTAHYDSTYLSSGSYDNMSGCIGLLGIAEYFMAHSHRYSLRFIWCGSEERGLLGSKAYTAAHEEELKNAVLNINLDMIGCVMGKFWACCSCEEKLAHYISYLSMELGFAVFAYQDVYSSDSSPFADKGVPALSFARIAPTNTATIHSRYDTPQLINPAQVLADIDFICVFASRMANAARCPVSRKIPDNVKEKLDIYFNRKRDPKKM